MAWASVDNNQRPRWPCFFLLFELRSDLRTGEAVMLPHLNFLDPRDAPGADVEALYRDGTRLDAALYQFAVAVHRSLVGRLRQKSG